MKLARRDFLKALGLAVGALASGAGNQVFAAPALALDALAEIALRRARALGCSYADVRLDRCVHAGGVTERCAVRVIHGGVWGVAVTTRLGEAGIARTVAGALASARAHALRGTDPFALERPSNEATRPIDVRSDEMYFSSTKGGHSRTLRRFA